MKREPRTCPYRKLQSPGSTSDCETLAACDLLARLSGISIDHPLVRVTRENCDYCCNEPVVASPTSLNPGVASYLFNLSCEVIASGGEAGCSKQSAEELQKLAIRHLRHGENRKEKSRRPSYTSACIYLGETTRSLDSDGSERYQCRHEFRPAETTVPKCHACQDYDPQLDTAPCVADWAVGLTTAPRRSPTLATTLDSLAAAGWDRPTVFAEPGTRIAKAFQQLKLVRRQEKLGAWPNFLLGLNELVLTSPTADAYLMVQDDAIFLRNTRDYLEATLWPHPRTGVVSLHTPSHHVPEDAATRGFFPREVGWAAWGAMAFVFSNASARALLRHPAVINHRSRGTGEGLCNVDSVVGHWCHLAGFEFYLHCPSLTQHIGLTTTLWSRDSLEGRRSASDFPGEDYDARQLIQRGATDSPRPRRTAPPDKEGT